MEYFKDGKKILPPEFDLKEAERIMDNFMTLERTVNMNFLCVVSFLILRGTGFDGGTSSHYLCDLLGVDSADRATVKRWNERKRG